jgi:hypothetical protein
MSCEDRERIPGDGGAMRTQQQIRNDQDECGHSDQQPKSQRSTASDRFVQPDDTISAVPPGFSI